MNIHLRDRLEEIRSSYWFLPILMALIAVLLALLTGWIDRTVPSGSLESLGSIWGGDVDGVRLLLTTIASSTITVAGVSFSILMVVLSQMSSQFGPHLLRWFMRDRGNQIVLGTLISAFIYCILILRLVYTLPERQVIPPLSVSVAVLLAFVSLVMLIYFIHHTAMSIQAPNVIADLGKTLLDGTDNLFPEWVGKSPPEKEISRTEALFQAYLKYPCVPVNAPRAGYIQGIDGLSLFRITRERDLLCVIKLRPGLFVEEGHTILEVYPPEKVDERLLAQLQNFVILDSHRTDIQDLEFLVDQIVQVAVRSLSAAVNDPLTTITCIDWLEAGLSRLAAREFPSSYRCDEQGKLRIVLLRPLTFAGLVNTAFDQIRQYASSSVAVSIHLMEALAVISDHARTPKDRAAIRRQADMLLRQSQREIHEPNDRRDLDERYLMIAK